MRKKLLIESVAITTTLATIILAMLCTSIFAWNGFHTDYDDDSDELILKTLLG